MDHSFKSKWGISSNFILYQKDSCGFSWPRRHFTCNFCNKEYKSAQALGGHMNIHRRDKARLGLASSSSIDHHQLQYPNPPNYLSSPSPARYLPYTYHSSLFPLVPTTDSEQYKLPLFACSGRAMEDEEGGANGTRVWKKYEILNMGLLKDGNNIELDLELRLGRS